MTPVFMGRVNSPGYYRRQLIYMALTRYGKHAEAWVMNNRPDKLRT